MHIYKDDAEFLAELEAKGFNVEVITQPANSPDTNLLDLGFFHAVQSANDEVAGGEGEMIQHIQQTFCSLSEAESQSSMAYLDILHHQTLGRQ